MTADSLAKKLGPKLKKARKRNPGMTQAKAALLAGVSRPDLSAMEKGKRIPRLHQLAALGKVYGTTPGELFSA
jgi:DNA-binding XRE family transcriptional regulator